MTFKEQSPASDGKSCEVPKRQGENGYSSEYFAHPQFNPKIPPCQGIKARFYKPQIEAMEVKNAA